MVNNVCCNDLMREIIHKQNRAKLDINYEVTSCVRSGIHISRIYSELFQELEELIFQEPQSWAQVKINQENSLNTHISQHRTPHTEKQNNREGVPGQSEGHKGHHIGNPPSWAGTDPRHSEFPAGEASGLAELRWYPRVNGSQFQGL